MLLSIYFKNFIPSFLSTLPFPLFNRDIFILLYIRFFSFFLNALKLTAIPNYMVLATFIVLRIANV